MKFVKVTAVAAAMAASFGAIAEMTALEDTDLEAVSGQAGITIEQSLGGLDVYYLDGDGVVGAAGEASQGGVLKIGGLQTVSIDTTSSANRGTVGTSGVSIRMDVDVAAGSTTASLAGNGAIRIKQSLAVANSASQTGALKIGSISIGGTDTNTQDDAAFKTGFNNLADTTGGTGSNPATSIGSVYVTGLDVDMYIYAH